MYGGSSTRSSTALDHATEQLISQLVTVRIEEANRLEYSADHELEAVRRKLQSMQRGIEKEQQSHALSLTQLKSSTLQQVHDVQIKLLGREQQLSELRTEIIGAEAATAAAPPTELSAQTLELLAASDFCKQQVAEAEQQLSMKETQLEAARGWHAASEKEMHEHVQKISTEHQTRIMTLTALLRELEHQQVLEVNRGKQLQLASALRQESREREWARAEGCIMRSEMNAIIDQITNVNEQAIVVEAECRLVGEDSEQLLSQLNSQIEQAAADPVFLQLAAAQQQLAELTQQPQEAALSMEQLTQQLQLTKQQLAESEQMAALAETELKTEQAQSVQNKLKSVESYSKLIEASGAQTIKRASRFD